MKHQKLSLALDIGHSSIGWALMEKEPTGSKFPKIHGTGAVTFPADDCLASERRDFRRQRRHIRATRRRIWRLRQLLLHLGALTAAELDAAGHAAPHWLAAGVLSANKKLSWLDLWHVLRWYAHNRGYDGNRRWANSDDDGEDTEKEANAILLMEKFGTASMAETVCAILEIKPTEERFSSAITFKPRNAAFPRKIVVAEVVQILEAHVGILPNLNEAFINTVVEKSDQAKNTAPAWKTIPVPGVDLPDRYVGGLLFGQLKPRFDNRIITPCRISGKNPPAKHGMDFLRYRWARLVANFRVNGNSLTKEQRQNVTAQMEEKGSLTVPELLKAITEITGAKVAETNLEAMFTLHPDSKDALVLDPALALFYGRGPGSMGLKPYWKFLPESVKAQARNQWKKRRAVDLQWMLDAIIQSKGDSTGLESAIKKEFDADQKKGKPRFVNREKFVRQSFSPKWLTGRSPYSSEVMKKVWAEIIENGWDSTKPCLSTNPDPAKGEDKPTDGVLYTSRELRSAERDRSLAEMTNNHLIRHRLQILEEKLLPDLVAEFCGGTGKMIEDAVVEVNRDLRDFSGKTQKEIAAEMNSRLRDFKSAVTYMENNAPDQKLTGGLIRKARIAMDLDWTCPFTGKKYGPYQLRDLELEHIIPYSLRRTNALHALVLTWPKVNAFKGKRTALEYVIADGGKSVPGDETLSIMSRRQYEDFVTKLDTKGHPDDRRRKWNRKNTLLVETYEPKDGGADFTEGMLTQTSQLVRLSCRRIETFFPHLVLDDETDEERRRVYSIPGRVTGEIRKAWNLMGALKMACPEIIDEHGGILPKDDIRSLTHLHHALDAIVLALTSRYIPRNGRVWKLITKRKLSPTEQVELKKACGDRIQFSQNGNLEVMDLPSDLKNEISRALAECRVVQHVPSDQSGAKAELNPWRVVTVLHGEAILMQRNSFTIETDQGGDTRRIWEKKEANPATLKLLAEAAPHLQKWQINAVKSGKLKLKTEKTGKLLGLDPIDGVGKLKKLQAVLILSDNYGLALDPTPQIIPHHKVSHRLSELRKANGGKPVRVLRKGMIIRVLKTPAGNKQDYTGLWQIVSVKNNKGGPAIDMVRPGYITPKNGVEWAGMNKGIAPLLKAGIEIVDFNYTGLPKE